MSNNAENGNLTENVESETRLHEDLVCNSGGSSSKSDTKDTIDINEPTIRAEVDRILAEVLEEVVARCDEGPNRPEPASCCRWCFKAFSIGLLCAIAIAGVVVFRLREFDRIQSTSGVPANPQVGMSSSMPPLSSMLPPRTVGILKCPLPSRMSSHISDDYCDCVDSSDEAFTAACSGADSATFTCADPLLPMTLPSSKVGDGVADCCDCSDEFLPPRLAKERSNKKLPSCNNTCEADAWARVDALRASAMDEASGALLRASVFAPAGQALHAAVRQALPGLEAQAAGYLKRFQDMQVAAARDPLQGRSYQAVMAIRSAQQQAQQAANQLGQAQALYKMDAGADKAWLGLKGTCAMSSELSEKRVKGGTSNVEVESYLYALCPFANATQLKPRDAEYWRLRFKLPSIDDDLPPIPSVESGSSCSIAGSSSSDISGGISLSSSANELVSAAVPLEATVTVDGSSTVNITRVNSSKTSSLSSSDSNGNDSNNSRNTTTSTVEDSSVVMETELPPKKKRKKKKKTAAVAPPPLLPEGPPVVLGHWSGWETPHPIPRPSDNNDDDPAALAPAGLTSGSSASAGEGLSKDGVGGTSRDQPLVFESPEAAEAHAVAQAAARAELALRSGIDEALTSAPLAHSRPRHYARPSHPTRPLGPGSVGGSSNGVPPSGGIVMRMSHGDACVGGPDRSVAINFVCRGARTAVETVEEDGMCTYYMRYSTPAACSDERADHLNAEANALEAAIREHTSKL